MLPQEPTKQGDHLPGSAFLSYLRAWRAYRGWSIPQLAKASGVSVDSISRLENEKRQAYAVTIVKLARALRIRPYILLGVDPADTEDDGRGVA